MVEHLSCKEKVPSSILGFGIFLLKTNKVASIGISILNTVLSIGIIA